MAPGRSSARFSGGCSIRWRSACCRASSRKATLVRADVDQGALVLRRRGVDNRMSPETRQSVRPQRRRTPLGRARLADLVRPCRCSGCSSLVEPRLHGAARGQAARLLRVQVAARSRAASRRGHASPTTRSAASTRTASGNQVAFTHASASTIRSSSRSSRRRRSSSRRDADAAGSPTLLELGAAVRCSSSVSGSFFFRRMGGAEGGIMSFARSRAKIYADDDVKVELRRRRGRRRGRRRAEGDRRVPQEPEEVHDARRAHSQGRAARRPAGHGQDAARARGRRRSARCRSSA